MRITNAVLETTVHQRLARAHPLVHPFTLTTGSSLPWPQRIHRIRDIQPRRRRECWGWTTSIEQRTRRVEDGARLAVTEQRGWLVGACLAAQVVGRFVDGAARVEECAEVRS